MNENKFQNRVRMIFCGYSILSRESFLFVLLFSESINFINIQLRETEERHRELCHRAHSDEAEGVEYLWFFNYSNFLVSLAALTPDRTTHPFRFILARFFYPIRFMFEHSNQVLLLLNQVVKGGRRGLYALWSGAQCAMWWKLAMITEWEDGGTSSEFQICIHFSPDKTSRLSNLSVSFGWMSFFLFTADFANWINISITIKPLEKACYVRVEWWQCLKILKYKICTIHSHSLVVDFVCCTKCGGVSNSRQ